MTRARNRNGIALVAALLLISFIALLIAGSLSASTIADRAEALALIDARLMTAADYVLHAPLGAPTAFHLAGLPLGVTTSLDVTSPDPGVIAHVSATRLPLGVIWLVADVSVPAVDQSRRRVNLVASFANVMPVPSAPIVARGNVRAGPNAVITFDTTSDADCHVAPGPVAMLAPGATAVGLTPAITDSRANDSATYALAPSQTTSLTGSGIVRTSGDTAVAGSFSGILIVNGDLTLSGPFSASGLVIARGRIDVSTHAFAIRGALLSFATPVAQSAIDLGDATVEFAPCVIQEKLWNVSILSAVKYRSWQELF